MTMEKQYIIPKPLINKREKELLVSLTEKYQKMTLPSKLSLTGEKVIEIIPKPVKNLGKVAKDGIDSITETQLFVECMKVVGEGFKILEQHATKMTISEKEILKKINESRKEGIITSLNEICLERGYKISNLVGKYKVQDLGLALAQGVGAGAFGFVGLPFNLVLSTFLYYRAVQSVAMFYGYDIKNDSEELIIAGQVFMNALSPNSKGANELSSVIGKIMLMTKITTIKQAAEKSWAEMAARGGVSLLLVQMRALANKAAQKGLEKAGKKSLEQSVFKEIFEQIGKLLSKKAIKKAIPVVGAVIGGLFDTAQMNTVVEYANIFYSKRFLLEKEFRVNQLLAGDEEDIIDFELEDIIDISAPLL